MRYIMSVFVVLFGTTLSAQDVAPKPRFEVASVKPTARVPSADPSYARVFHEIRRNRLRIGEIPMTGSNHLQLRNWPLLDLIATAYSVPITQVSGPSWLSDQSYDIEALVPDGTEKQKLNAMLQSLLEERFALKVHRTTQNIDGYAIVVNKGGPKLRPAELPSDALEKLSEEAPDTQLLHKMATMQKHVNDGPVGATIAFSTWPSITLDELAPKLSQWTDAPVVDGTGLKGRYSITIEVSQNYDSEESTIFEAVERLGLKLVKRKVTINALAIDNLSKFPTEN